MNKPVVTKKEFNERVNEEAIAMRKQGVTLSLAECKREAKKVFIQEYIITNKNK